MSQPTPPPQTVSAPALLVAGSDAAFRTLIHDFLSHGHLVGSIRDGFAQLLGVSSMQYEILMAVRQLQGARGVTVTDIAQWLHRSGAFITIECGRLAQRGLIRKTADTADRRRVLLRLTPQADAKLAELAPVQQQVNDALFAALDAPGFAALAGMMAALLPCAEHAADLLGVVLKQQRRQAA